MRKLLATLAALVVGLTLGFFFAPVLLKGFLSGRAVEVVFVSPADIGYARACISAGFGSLFATAVLFSPSVKVFLLHFGIGLAAATATAMIHQKTAFVVSVFQSGSQNTYLRTVPFLSIFFAGAAAIACAAWIRRSLSRKPSANFADDDPE